jgi:hypothetical protein
MISFRKFVLVGAMLAAFAGLASAQTVSSFTVLPESYPTLRAEGLTELIPALDFNLNLGPAGALADSSATYDIYIYGKAGAPFTSPAADILVSGGTFTPGSALVTGAVVKLPAVNFPFLMGVMTAKVTVTGIRVDANAIGANSPLSFQIVAIPTSGGSAVLAPVAENIDTVTVGTISTSLVTTVSNSSNNPITGSTTTGPWTSIDGAGNPFDPTETDPAKLALQSPLFTTTFTPQFAGAFWTSGIEKPLRFTFTVTNIPAGLTLYVPQTTAQLVLINGADANGLGGYPAYPTVAAYPLPSTGMVTYEAIAPNGGLPPGYTIPVYAAGVTPIGLTTAAAPFTFMGSYAPLSADISASASAPILRFSKTSVTEIDSFLIVHLPSSRFAFPYVVTGNGWVTGIAIVNAGAGFGSAAKVSMGNAGTCALTFYSADGTAVAPATVTVPLTGAAISAIPAGGNYGFTLEQAIGTGSYAGIVYGTCNFDNVKAFGYLNGDGTTAAYLAQ